MKTNQYIVFLFGLILLISGKAFAAPGMSEINNELFDKAHLKNIDQPHKCQIIEKFIDNVIIKPVHSTWCQKIGD